MFNKIPLEDWIAAIEVGKQNNPILSPLPMIPVG